MNMVTKSGTNSYHGSGWEFFRNQSLDARNPFTDFDSNHNPIQTPFHQNEYGGTFGGPVRIPKLYNGRDKTFFFVAYEGWRYLKPASATYISPTAAELSGDFTMRPRNLTSCTTRFSRLQGPRLEATTGRFLATVIIFPRI